MNKVSVIVPAYNRESVLASTLDTLLGQTYENWECIIVDDGSTDKTVKIAGDYCIKDNRFKLVFRDREPKNANTCRNIGLEKSTGDFVIFLDSDDMLSPQCMANRIDATVANPDNDFWIFKVWKQEGDKRTADSLYLHKEMNMLYLFLEMKLPWLVTSPLWRREFIVGLKGFDERLERLQDVDLHIRALLALRKGYYIDKNGEPDWAYCYRSFNKEQRNLSLLQKKIDSCLFLCNWIKSLDSRHTRIIKSLQKGMSVCFLNFLYENVLNDFRGTGMLKSFVEELYKLDLFDKMLLTKLKMALGIPGFFLKLPGAYRILKLFLV